MTLAPKGIAVACLLVFAGASSAENYLPAGDDVHERIWEITPFGGVFLPDDNSGYTGTGPQLGLRLGINNSHRWGLETYAAYATGLKQEYRTGRVESYDFQPVYNSAGVLVGYVFTNLETSEEMLESDSSLLTAGIDATLNFSTGSVRPFLLAGAGFIEDLSNTEENPPGPFSNLFVNFGAGVKYYRPSGLGFRLELRDVLLEKDNLPRLNARAALTAAENDVITVGGSDGVFGSEPYSPDLPRGKRWLHNFNLQASVTFPLGWAWKDGDGDGVATRFDEAPSTAPGVVVDELGRGIDTDGDGVFDGLDECEATPIGATVNLVGCPSDSDGDGVLDGLDVDDTTPLGALVDARGQHFDTDQDGVWDGLDECEGTPTGVSVDAKGCADDEVERRLLVGETLVIDNIEFELGSAEIEPLSYHYLNKAARLIERWTGNEERPIRLEIGVHTDGLGDDQSNNELTQRQADAIRAYLLDNFFQVAANNLVATGYGEQFPVASDDTAEGREANRRVELKMIGEGDAPQFFEASGDAAPGDEFSDEASDLLDELTVPEPELPDGDLLPEPELPDVDPE